MTVTITSRDAERIARNFNDLISPKGLLRIRRKAVNEIGSRIRKQTRVIAPEVIGTSAAALEIKGKAASPGSTDPEYRLRMASRIPIARLKASHRKVTRRRGRKSLEITLPGGDKIMFRSIHRDGKSFRLLQAGPLPERGVGGVYVNSPQAFGDEGYPELIAIRQRGERDLPGVVAALIETHLGARK